MKNKGSSHSERWLPPLAKIMKVKDTRNNNNKKRNHKNSPIKYNSGFIENK